MHNKIKLEIKVNNKVHILNIEPRLLLVDLIRKELNLTGTHIGCDTSQCGSCIVFLDKKCIKSCSILAIKCNGKSVQTIESLGDEANLHKVQKAFKDNHGLQCGFCTPGIIMTALEIKKNNIYKENEIRQFLDGNLCRCTGYHNIVKSISSYIKGIE